MRGLALSTARCKISSGLAAGFFSAMRVERAVNDALRGALLAADHDGVDQAADQRAADISRP